MPIVRWVRAVVRTVREIRDTARELRAIPPEHPMVSAMRDLKRERMNRALDELTEGTGPVVRLRPTKTIR